MVRRIGWLKFMKTEKSEEKFSQKRQVGFYQKISSWKTFNVFSKSHLSSRSNN